MAVIKMIVLFVPEMEDFGHQDAQSISLGLSTHVDPHADEAITFRPVHLVTTEPSTSLAWSNHPHAVFTMNLCAW